MKPSGEFRHDSEASLHDTEVSLPELSGVRHRFLDLPGLRMHVAEAGAGAPLLLLHGFPQHWWAWRKVIPGLAVHYRLICPSARVSAGRRTRARRALPGIVVSAGTVMRTA